MADLELPVDRAGLLLVELQNDIVRESNIGKRGFTGVLAATVTSSDAVRGALGC